MSRLFFGAAFVPPLLVLVLVLVLGVNVPYSDEWDWAPLFSAAQHGTLTFAELWRQHNEHRIIFPDLLALGLSTFGGWNIIHEEIASVALCVASAGVLWRLVGRTLPEPSRPAAFLAMSVALWNAGQAENFAVGFQMAWFVVELGVLIVVWRLSSTPLRRSDILLAVVAATVAAGCLEVGLLAWPVGLAALVLGRRASKAMALGWVACGAVVYAIYRIGFVEGGLGHVPLAPNFGGLIVYSLAYLGVPVAYWSGLIGCTLAGSALTVAFVWLAFTDGRRFWTDAAAWTDRAPWFALGLFAILGAVSTGPSRLGLGLVSVVTTTRYITVSLWLSVAVVALAAQRVRPAASRCLPWPIARSAVILAIVCATTTSFARGIRDWQHFSWARKADVRALRSGDDGAVAPYYLHRDVLEADVRTIRALHDGPLGP